MSVEVPSPFRASDRWLHRYAILVVICTLGLIALGGLVTSREAGMAVPDWPTTYGYNMFFFPIRLWQGGIFDEHVHRLADQRMADPAAARDRIRHHPADAGLGVFQPRRRQSSVGHQLDAVGPVAFGEHMHALRVGAVHVLKHAVLLHHEHLAAQGQQAVEGVGSERIKRQAAPVRGSFGSQARASLSTNPMRGKCTCSRPARSSVRSSV